MAWNYSTQRQSWLDVYRHIGYIPDIFDTYNFYAVFFIFFNVTVHGRMMSTVCVFCWLMTCALSIFSVLDNFCQIAPLHSNAV